jgi:type VI secretion system secreted protein VgrG
MTHFIVPNVIIDGKLLKPINSFKLEQATFSHHEFEIICSKESIHNILGYASEVFDNLVGIQIDIILTAATTKSCLLFTGLISQVKFSPFKGSASNVSIVGSSPTILMDNGPHCKSWERKVLKNILKDVLSYFPSDRVKAKITSVYSETLPYTVQYNETCWQFLKRLVADCGEWLYYDGQQLVIGPQQEEIIDLVYGISLRRFEILKQCRPINFQLLAYDYINHQLHVGNSEPGNINSLRSDHALMVDRSKLLYSTQAKQYLNRHVTNKRQLSNFIAIRKERQINDMVNCHGCSTVPEIRPGAKIHIRNTEPYGDYIITSVQHLYDEEGNYKNEFMGVPASVKCPPIQLIMEPRCETQPALVIDNDDKKGLKRVRVKFHWMEDNEKSPWLPVVQPQAYSDKEGFSINLPFIGQEVMVAFQGDNPARPYVLGVLCKGNGIDNLTNEDKETTLKKCV